MISDAIVLCYLDSTLCPTILVLTRHEADTGMEYLSDMAVVHQTLMADPLWWRTIRRRIKEVADHLCYFDFIILGYHWRFKD